MYFHFELLLSSSSSKLDEVHTNEIILTHCVHLELYKLIMYRCIFELFGRQNLHYFTNEGVIYYCLQNFAWTHQTIINLIHVLSGLLILFICQDRVRVQTKACQHGRMVLRSGIFLYSPQTKFGGVYRNHPVCLSVCLSICLSRVNLTLTMTI